MFIEDIERRLLVVGWAKLNHNLTNDKVYTRPESRPDIEWWREMLVLRGRRRGAHSVLSARDSCTR